MEYIDTGLASAGDNMAYDTALLQTLPNRSEPVLHAYGWRGLCVTYGHFTKPLQWLDGQAIEELAVDLARRPTGGGITLHFSDLAFSFLLPAQHPAFSLQTQQNYAFVNNIVATAITTWRGCQPVLQSGDSPAAAEGCCHFCMARPTQYDLLLDGRKVGGAAQRRTRHGYLHQGTILLTWPEEQLLHRIVSKPAVRTAMRQHSYPLLENASQSELSQARHELMAALKSTFQQALSWTD